MPDKRKESDVDEVVLEEVVEGRVEEVVLIEEAPSNFVRERPEQMQYIPTSSAPFAIPLFILILIALVAGWYLVSSFSGDDEESIVVSPAVVSQQQDTQVLKKKLETARQKAEIAKELAMQARAIAKSANERVEQLPQLDLPPASSGKKQYGLVETELPPDEQIEVIFLSNTGTGYSQKTFVCEPKP